MSSQMIIILFILSYYIKYLTAIYFIGFTYQIYCSTEGIDVSVWQGTIDWNRVKSEKSFSFIRASYGHTRDSRFEENWQKAKAVDMPVGPYHYFEPGDDPTEQAEAFCRFVGDLQKIAPVVDCETMGSLTVDEYQSKVLTWLKYVEKHYGVTPMIYTGVYHGNTYFNNEEFAKYPLWIANWGVSEPKIPGKWTSYAYWQYSDHGSVSGIDGNVDLDKSK